MTFSSELALAVLALTGVIGLALYVLRHPDAVVSTLQVQIDGLRLQLQEMHRVRAEDRAELQQERAELGRVAEENRKLAKAYVQALEEMVRLREIIGWLRQKLREHGVDIPRLPAELQEPRIDPSMVVQIEQGGVRVSDQGRLSAGRDVVGGNVEETEVKK